MWARGQVVAEECPVSLITPLSVQLLEKFHEWKFCGGGLEERASKEADAIVVLEREWRELSHGE